MSEKLWIAHHGIKGQQWGIKNGPPYPLDSSKSTGSVLKKKTSQKRVFVSGSSKTQDKSSEYYLRKLPKGVRKELKSKIKNNDIIMVGDAPGIDRQVQDYLKKKHYKNVEVYSPGKQPRYIANKKWKNTLVDSKHPEGSPEWLAKKDKVMSKLADEGIAVILNKGGAKATRNNINRLIDNKKNVSIYELNPGEKKKKDRVKSIDQKNYLTSKDLKAIEKMAKNAPSIKHKPGVTYNATKFNDYVADKYMEKRNRRK